MCAAVSSAAWESVDEKTALKMVVAMANATVMCGGLPKKAAYFIVATEKASGLLIVGNGK